jgi:dolichyl-phosphate beta-glucosyltransferase
VPEISVIIPAYNEERRLPSTLNSVYEFLTKYEKDFEILVVDDGSIDHTVDIVEEFSKNHNNIRLLSYLPNKGKGYAVKHGILAAKGDVLLINDADGSSPIEELVRLTAAIDNSADVAIGSRAKPDDSRVVKALAYRKLIGNTFNLIVQSLLLPGIYDTQCGFKMFKRNVARDIFSVAHLDGFGFDVEVLYIARIRNYKIVEIPINWTNVEGSKVNLFFDSPKMFIDVLNVVVSKWLGKYKSERGTNK